MEVTYRARLAMVAILFGLVAPAHARVASTDLDGLASGADVIGVMRVDQIETIKGVRIARATVVTPLAGCKAGQTFFLVAEPTWTCDVGEARTGEKSVFCLSRLREPLSRLQIRELKRALQPVESDKRIHTISHAGRGHFPVVRKGTTDWLNTGKYGFDLLPAEGKGDRLAPLRLTDFKVVVRKARIAK